MDATAQELVARLRRNPNDTEAFAALRAHYQRIGDYASLANLLEGWAGRAPDKSAAAHAMYEAGELVLGALADRERAIRMYEHGLAMDPRHRDAFLRLRGLFEETGEMRRLGDLLERQAQALQRAGTDLRDVALLYHQLGELWEHRFGRVDKAVNHYRKAFELDPGFVAAIYAAREIYRAAGNVKAAATLLEKEAKAELDVQRKIALYRELAHTRAEDLNDPEGATLALKRALSEAPGDLDVMNDLARVYLQRAERTDDPHVAQSDRHRAADLLYQMGQKVPNEHAIAYLEQALDARPDHDGAMALFERHSEEMHQLHRLPARWVAYLANAPNRPEAAYRRKRLAAAYLESGQVDYAITCLEWLLDEGDPEAAEELVGLYRQAGREEDAMRALGVAARGLPPNQRVPRLRELVAALRDRGDLAQAAGFAIQILEVEPSDPEALHLLENACRQSGDYLPYRDALLSASRAGGSNAGERTLRLKQVAQISEKKLDDLEGAISAWRGVASLAPADAEARTSLKRLFTETERWDDLVDELEREALSITEVDPKAEIYRQLAGVHRDHRQDLPAAITALRHLRDLLPGDLDARDALSDALVSTGAYLEAIPLLRQRLESASGPRRVELLRLLATILEEQIGDEDGAFECWAEILDESPSDLDALGRMEGIDAASGRHERLLSTLSYKAEVIEESERAAVLLRMAQIADRELDDLSRSADFYARALELAPGDAQVLDALSDVYERADRYRDLVVLLRETANREQDPRRRAELYRRIARTLADAVGSDDGAAEAYREVLLAGEDEEALRFLHRYATQRDDPESLQDVLARLAVLVEDELEARAMRWQRAQLLADRLGRPHDAIAVLEGLVEAQPDHVAALQRLAALSEDTGNHPGLANALWRQLDVLEDPGLRVPIAQRLADLHEPGGAVPAPDRAIRALDAWSEADCTDAAPLERIVPLLEGQEEWAELTEALDALAGLQGDEASASELTRKSAKIAYRQLGDVDGAWDRLEPRVREHGDADAERELRELAEGANQGERLAEMYVAAAQASEEIAVRAKRWMDAAEVYERFEKDLTRALEAVLRAFAVDLSDLSLLDEADRLARESDAWGRLGQVYESLVRRAESKEIKVGLLLRHAELILASDASAALDQTLRACSLDPHDDAVLVLAEERAVATGRAEDLLVTYDKRKATAPDDAGRVEALLRSARLCESTLRDRERATHHLALAVALAVRTPELAEEIERIAKELDAAPDAVGGVRDTLVQIYARLAEDMEDDPVGGAALLLRGAALLHSELGRSPDALAALQRASVFAPAEASVLDELERFAREVDRTDVLEQHFAKLIDDALDSRTAAGLLRRRGALLEELSRFGDAADVWTRLSSVSSGDAHARERLRACLREAGQLEDLLVALQRDLRKSDDPADRLGLRKEIAGVWDRDLQNRWEALDAWKKVLIESPGDEEALAAIERLDKGGRRRDEASDFAIPAPSSTDAEIDDPLLEDLEDVTQDLMEAMAFKDRTEPGDSKPGSGGSGGSSGPGEPTSAGDPADDPSDLDDDDDSATLFDDGLQAQLMARLGRAPGKPAEPAPPALPEPEITNETPMGDPLPPRPTRKLRTSELKRRSEPERPASRPPRREASAPVSMPAFGDFSTFDDEDYTSAEDVFQQLRQEAGPNAYVGEDLHTSELELLDEGPASAETLDSRDDVIFGTLEAVQAEVLGIDDVEELEDISGLQELDEPSGVQELGESDVHSLDEFDFEEIED